MFGRLLIVPVEPAGSEIVSRKGVQQKSPGASPGLFCCPNYILPAPQPF
jgi:hypothetical protein